jgi:DNA-binding response OmpR family regulator
MTTRLLIVEDDESLQNVLNEFLQSEGFVTDVASTGSKALEKIYNSTPSLVLLDLGLPDMDGESVLIQLRKDYPELPVVILTAKSKPHQIAEGLNLGANDYLPKPFAAEELLARINVRLKRNVQGNDVIKVSDLVLNLSNMSAKRGKKDIDLTKTEFELLKYLMENTDMIKSREMILNHVWDYATEVESRVVDVYIGYLRKKVDKSFKKKLIKNKRGFGYYIKSSNE